jgi:nucleotide-binding universal stress UspA family protein
MKTALVPVTGTSLDEVAVGMACDIVKPNRGTVYVLYIIEVPMNMPLDAELTSEAARGERVLQAMERIGKSHKCKVEGEILQARSVGPAIVDESSQRGADMVVIGAPYLEHFGSPTTGDLVPYLLKYNPSPVLIYRGEQNGAGNN